MFKKPLSKYSGGVKNKENLPGRNGITEIGAADDAGVEHESTLDSVSVSDTDDIADNLESRGRPRDDRRSLSERTIETLSQIPPSPVSSRRPSSFLNPPSPMRSPSRPASSMNTYSRSPSRSSYRQQSGSDLSHRSPSTSRLPSRSQMPTLPANGSSTEHASTSDLDSPSKPKTPSVRQPLATNISSSSFPTPKGVNTLPAPRSYTASKNPTPAATKSRSHLDRSPSRPVDSERPHGEKTLHVKKTRKPASTSTSQPSTVSKASATASAPGKPSESEMKTPSKSSTALRESIAKAKAARKAAKQNAQGELGDPWEIIDDPFNQKPKDSNYGLLRKRVEAARTSGHLNIAAMSLKEIPSEVTTMYDFDPDSSTDWYESVDLVKFIAADNELDELPDTAFPDTNPDELDPDADEKGNQFGGLELLDLHGNVLHSLPIGLRRLMRLHTLNLSNNKLSMKDIQLVTEIPSLRDLRLANNQLEGEFTPDIGRLTDLEVLDLRENSLTTLPETLAELHTLKVLNIGQNQLVSLPFESLSKLPLKEINAPKNRLEGTLIPGSLTSFGSLRSLDVASNALKKLSENEYLEFPNLQTLSINSNRIQCLPDMTSWKALLTLSAEDNSLAQLPPGFVTLKSVRNVDFTGNDISRLDERLGLMESLVTFRIANNPLRERKFLSMSTEELLHDLQNRCEPEHHDTDEEEGSVTTQFTLAPESPTQNKANVWQVKPGGVLDRSYSNMKALEAEKLEQINSQDIRCLYLQHNELCHMPPAISMLAHSLVDLDLSHNPLDDSAFMSSSITIPNLQRLNLSAAGLSTLELLFSCLSAPSLSLLDISNNRLSGLLPAVRQSYPSLMTLLASDNRFNSLEFAAVQGLQVLDVSNNDIESLPPKLGLLRADGLSKNWGNGSALRRFEAAGNRFRVPRWQIVEKGTDAILEWLKDRIPTEELLEWEPETDAL